MKIEDIPFLGMSDGYIHLIYLLYLDKTPTHKFKDVIFFPQVINWVDDIDLGIWKLDYLPCYHTKVQANDMWKPYDILFKAVFPIF